MPDMKEDARDLPPLPEPDTNFPKGESWEGKPIIYTEDTLKAYVLADRALRGDGRTAVAADLLRSALGPLEVSAAIEDSEDGGESIDTLITCIKLFLDQHDGAALRSLGGKKK